VREVDRRPDLAELVACLTPSGAAAGAAR